MNPVPSRLPAVDLLKALAAQLIVWHHLAFYGPMSDHVAPLVPALMEGLARHARIAVQVFLVIGGFLAARQLAPLARWPAGAAWWPRLADRYLRLVLPYAAMLVLAVLAAAVARTWMDHASVPAAPGAWQVLAHLLLLQDLVGIEALSAGVWYIAIDFQLFALLLTLLAGAAAVERRWGLVQPLAPWAVAALVALSMFHFNRAPAWDVAAPYFFAAYGLGVLAAWSPLLRRRTPFALLLMAVVALALIVEFRGRLLLAAGVALWLGVLADRWRDWRGPVAAAIGALARTSYAIFLVHFPVCLLVNAAFARFAPAEPGVQAVGLLLAWAASVGAGFGFHHAVERRASRWLAARRGGPRRPVVAA